MQAFLNALLSAFKINNMADEKNTGIHNIFITNPLKLMNYVDKYVEIKLENNTALYGTVYTIDPVSESVVLIKQSENGTFNLQIVMKNSIKSMEICPSIPDDQQNINLTNLFQNKNLSDQLGYKKTSEMKEKVKAWLVKNMIPITEDGDVLKMDTLQIHPPYGLDQCYCSNPIVLSRIQTLLQAMPIGNS